MKKIPFSLDFRQQIESDIVKVVTRQGTPVSIWAFDAPSETYPVIGFTKAGNSQDIAKCWTTDGHHKRGHLSGLDLFILREQPEGVPLTANTLTDVGFILRSESPYRKNYELPVTDKDSLFVELHEKGNYCKVDFHPLGIPSHISLTIYNMTVHQLYALTELCEINIKPAT